MERNSSDSNILPAPKKTIPPPFQPRCSSQRKCSVGAIRRFTYSGVISSICSGGGAGGPSCHCSYSTWEDDTGGIFLTRNLGVYPPICWDLLGFSRLSCNLSPHSMKGLDQGGQSLCPSNGSHVSWAASESPKGPAPHCENIRHFNIC